MGVKGGERDGTDGAESVYGNNQPGTGILSGDGISDGTAEENFQNGYKNDQLSGIGR